MPSNRLGNRPRNPNDEDGTTQLLRGGGVILAVGTAAVLALLTVFGGISVEGAHSNAGWFALIMGATCLPFGLLVTSLGVAKWLRNRSLSGKL